METIKTAYGINIIFIFRRVRHTLCFKGSINSCTFVVHSDSTFHKEYDNERHTTASVWERKV